MTVEQTIAEARAAGRTILTEVESKSILATLDVVTPKGLVVTDETGLAGHELQAPMALKVVTGATAHKSDIGGVRLGLDDLEAARRALGEIRAACREHDLAPDRFLLEEMAPSGVELLVGGRIDPQFGAIVMVGLGGLYVEIFEDVATRLCPITEDDAQEMIASLKAAPILHGARGQDGVDLAAVVDVLLRIGGADGLLMRYPDDIAELDINPLIASSEGAVAADAAIVLSDGTVTVPREGYSPAEFTALFEPRAIAVVGASGKGRNRANELIDQALQFGFAPDRLYPIHPSAPEINGLPAYPSLGETPSPVDYAIVNIPAPSVAGVISAAKGKTKFAHIFTSGFSEVGNHELQDELVVAARDAGVRLIGPNCNGGHSPRGGFSFSYDVFNVRGSVGVLLQSGGLGIDMLRRGANRGLEFSGVMTIGNCADVTANDMLEFYLADAETRVVGMYLEGVEDGRRLYRLLRERNPVKPVVILKGGRSELASAAAASHTGSLTGDGRIWETLCRQTGVVLTRNLDEFIYALAAFQSLETGGPDPDGNVILIGNGGGTSVLAVDTFADCDVDVSPFAPAVVSDLVDLGLAAGASYENPIDLPRPVLVGNDGRDVRRVVEVVMRHGAPHSIVFHINMNVVIGASDPGVDNVAKLLKVIEGLKREFAGQTHFVLVLRADGSADYEGMKFEIRKRAVPQGIPVFDELTNAAAGLAALREFERYCRRPG